MKLNLFSGICKDTSQADSRLATEQLKFTVADVAVGGGKCYLVIKRLFDVLASLITGLLLLIPMLVIAVIIRLDSPGSPLFKQERLGKNGVPFIMYKFRSMYTDAEENGPKWADRNDQRCTRVGHFLRSTRLDELPQLLNIFLGEMSFVGPRPERACFYDEFETYIHGFRNRLKVKPGLTGYAQVNGGYDLKPEEKILYDMEYIQNRSLRMDLGCIVKTVKLVFTHEGAR
ncbi:MAG: sugar transferase [Firmicutes bacterium]|nr:sugar transferase [Bacillota bacterium]